MTFQIPYKTVFRIKYACYFVGAVLAIFRPETFSGPQYTDWPAGLSDADQKFTSVSTALYWIAAGAIYAGAAQVDSEAAQRKIMQYTILHPIIELVCIARVWGQQAESKLQTQASACVISIAFTVMCLYVFNKKPKASSKGKEASKCMTCTVRLLYVYHTIMAVMIVADPLNVGSKVAAASSGYLSRVGCVHVLLAMTLMAAAQCGGDVQKKFLQYSMCLPVLNLLFKMPLALPALWVKDDSGFTGPVLAYTFAVIGWIRICLPVLACYKQSCRTWMLRGSHLFYGAAGFWHVMYPNVAGFFFQYDDGVCDGSVQMGLFMIVLSVMYAAACESDEGFTQAMVVKYSMFADLALVCGYFYFGGSLVLALCAGKSFVGKAWDVIADEKGWATPTCCGLFNKSGPGSPRMKMKKRA